MIVTTWSRSGSLVRATGLARLLAVLGDLFADLGGREAFGHRRPTVSPGLGGASSKPGDAPPPTAHRCCDALSRGRTPASPPRTRAGDERALQTAETCSSSATRKEEPQPHAAMTFGLSTLNPRPGARRRSRPPTPSRTAGWRDPPADGCPDPRRRCPRRAARRRRARTGSPSTRRRGPRHVGPRSQRQPPAGRETRGPSRHPCRSRRSCFIQYSAGPDPLRYLECRRRPRRLSRGSRLGIPGAQAEPSDR